MMNHLLSRSGFNGGRSVVNIRQKRKLLAQQLKESLADLEKAAQAMAYSESKCLAIGPKDAYDLEEQEVFEALTARFARASDILTQQTLVSLFNVTRTPRDESSFRQYRRETRHCP